MFFKSAKAPIKAMTAPEFIMDRLQHGKIASRMERIALDTNNNFYLDVWAVSSYEKFGLNENADGFEHDELDQSFRTFKGSWTCLDHQNHDVKLAVGTNIDALYSPDQYVRIVMAVDRLRSEARHPGLEQKIEAGIITDTSMGCWARESVCCLPKCGNIATEEDQFCEHVTAMRGQTICDASTNWTPIKCGELNRGVVFFEDSIITDEEGADRNAKILAKLASSQSGPKSIPADVLYREMQRLSKNASRDELAFMTNFMENLSRLLD